MESERGIGAMYRSNVTRTRRKRRHEGRRVAAGARRNEENRSGARRRVVRVPGGFVYVGG